MKKSILIASAVAIIYFMNSNKAFGKPTLSGTIRGCDKHGCGNFGASRGGRDHQGEDYSCSPGTAILSPICGKVTRIAYPYASDLSYKGLEIVNSEYSAKIFYMAPSIAIGTTVVKGQVIGTAQNIASKYSAGMVNHIHVEIRNAKGKLIALSSLT